MELAHSGTHIVCILSATGAIGSVKLSLAATPSATTTYEVYSILGLLYIPCMIMLKFDVKAHRFMGIILLPNWCFFFLNLES